MTKLLLVSHEASLTGAPRVAAEILRAAGGAVDETVVVIRWPGPLAAELAAAADRARLEPFRRTRVALRRFRRTRPAAIRVEQAAARRILRREKPDLVYLNTVLSACYARPALDLGCKVVLHSHELGNLASGPLARYGLDPYYGRIRLVACSGPAGRRLQEITGAGDVTVVPSVVDSERVVRMAGGSTDPADDRRRLPGSAVGVVVACGTADPVKGTDLWLRVVRGVHDRLGSECPQFRWIGEDRGGRFLPLARELAVEDRVEFLGAIPNPYPWMAGADIVVVPSRQDAFPLVVMEAMVLGKPVVAFDVGGIPDQLGDTGVLVPAEDVEAMADAVVRLLSDEGARRALGSAAARRVRDRYSLESFRHQVAGVVREELER